MMRRVLAYLFPTAAALAVLVGIDGAQADDTKEKGKPAIDKSSPALDTKATKEELAIKQLQLQLQFNEFKATLLRLAQRMAVSPKAEDKEKAKVLKLAVEKANEEGVEQSFDKLVAILRNTSALEASQVDQAVTENEQLTARIRAILQLLLTDNRDEQLKREREAAMKRLEELKRIIREQEVTRNNTEMGRKGKEQLGKEQNKVTNDTESLAKGSNKSGSGAEGKAGKGEGKAGEGKGEGKNDTKDAKGGDKGGKEGKPGEEKSGKKDDKPGEEKGDAKKPGVLTLPEKEKNAENKGEGKKGDGEAKPGQKSEGKGKGDGKGEGKGSESKGEGQGSESKPGGGKSGGQGQQQPGGSKPADPQQQQPPQEPQDFQGKKQIQEGNEFQKEAEKDLNKGNNDAASNKQGDALKKLKEAQKKLEDLLRQLREEEIERILAALQMRFERMLAMQTEVRDNTVGLDKDIQARPGAKPENIDRQRGNELEEKEQGIIKEGNEARRLLEAEGSAVAFPVVLEGTIEYMVNVARRLRATDTGAVTVTIENEIIDSLKEMIEALKKARQENQKKSQGGGGGGGGGSQPLIEELQELKMIRNMQLRVNRMTETYSKEYEGEQSPDPSKVKTPQERDKAEMLQKELKGLADRETKIVEVTNNLYKGKNK